MWSWHRISLVNKTAHVQEASMIRLTMHVLYVIPKSISGMSTRRLLISHGEFTHLSATYKAQNTLLLSSLSTAGMPSHSRFIPIA